MDIAAALAVTPPTPLKQESAPEASAPSNGDSSAATSFEEEFASAVAPADDDAAETADAETEAGESALVADNELLIEAEDLTVAPLESAAEETQTAADAVDAPADAVVAETPAAEEAETATAETIEIAAIEDAAPAVETDAETVASDGAADLDASEAGAVDASDMMEAATANADAEPAVIAAFAVTASADDAAVVEETAAAPVELSAAVEEEAEIEPESLTPRDNREKAYMSHGFDRLQTFARLMQEGPVEPAFRTQGLEMAASAAIKAEAAAPVHADSDAVASQVTAAIRADKGAAGSIDVRLDPPELGRVRIHFNMERADVVVATVSSERGETLDLLRRHSADLTRELERAGFASVQLDFASNDGGAFESWERPEAPGYGEALAESAVDEQIVAYVRKSQSRLDRFV